MDKRFTVAAVLILSLTMAGCATWSSSSVKPAPGTTTKPQTATAPARAEADIIVTENDINDKPYTVIGDISVNVNKTTIFNSDPTHAQADEQLRHEAAKLGADAVILVRYGSVGVGLMSWGSLNAKGRAVKFN